MLSFPNSYAVASYFWAVDPIANGPSRFTNPQMPKLANAPVTMTDINHDMVFVMSSHASLCFCFAFVL